MYGRRIRRPGSAVRIATAAALLAGCGGGDTAPFPPMDVGPGWTLAPAVRELIAGTPADSLEIASLEEVTIDGATFLLADFGAHRVLRLDTLFALLDAFGSEGAGPGELLRPSMVVPWKDELVVGEWANGRFSVFDRDGNYRRSIPGVARPESHGVRGDGSIITPSASLDHYAVLLSTDGGSQPFAARPPSLMAPDGVETLGGDATRLLVGPGDTTHVFDNQWGILLKYDPEGRLVLARSVPDDVMDPVKEYRRKFVEAFARQGRRVLGMALIHSMSFADDGSIIVHIGRGNTAAIRIDPHDYSMRPISVDTDDPVWALVRQAATLLIVGETCYAFSSSGLVAHPLIEAAE